MISYSVFVSDLTRMTQPLADEEPQTQYQIISIGSLMKLQFAKPSRHKIRRDI